eukprot:TRINITY_DN32692_c0_g1_i1.p1 TRINITY_DN32692_c0_g1~~TRINITY_DN32692_c0_g1_i1.p1  ORF type:complete len:460 (+),score=131.23 TRINITY_DN32692_c0_g1_i1:153-1532(+)
MPKRRSTESAPRSKKRARTEDDLFDFNALSDEEISDVDENLSEEERENEQEKRIKEAEAYVERLATEAAEASDEEDGNDMVQRALEDDVKRKEGRLYKAVAAKYENREFTNKRFTKGHKLPITCLTLSGDDTTAYTGSKDCCILQWDVESGKKTVFHGRRKTVGEPKPDIQGHINSILAIDVSSDGRYLASGGLDNVIKVWDTRTGTVVENFNGHKGNITALAFRQNSHMLFSGSTDRTVKTWNLDEMCFIETLFGHTDTVTCLDSFIRERAVSASVDRSVRLWKVVEESQLLFSTPHRAAIDSIRMLNEGMFFCGGQDGGLSLWHVGKKRPSCFIANAHGKGSWITSVSALRNSDLMASGSSDGYVKLWTATDQKRRLTPVTKIEVPGFVNGLAFARSGKFMLAASSQEPRLGRWERNGRVKNGLWTVTLDDETIQEESEDDSESDDEALGNSMADLQ